MSSVLVLSVQDIIALIHAIGLKDCFSQLYQQLKEDFAGWQSYQLSPRHATHYPHGVIELMPFSNDTYYSFKYVNGHPFNTTRQKQSVVAFGALARVSSGYPVMLSEMTLLTALRTAATSALASHYLARPDARVMGIIGTGAQSEFQILAHHFLLGIDCIRYFDIDPKAMQKMARNLEAYPIQLVPCSSVAEVVEQSDIITTLTADKVRAEILNEPMIKPGIHINAVGGDCPGKVELDARILLKAKVVVEYTEQSRIEGEIQNSAELIPHAELWELVTGSKPGRARPDEVTVFDSVGFAMEDFSVLYCFYQLAQKHKMGSTLSILPELSNPKDLFSLIADAP